MVDVAMRGEADTVNRAIGGDSRCKAKTYCILLVAIVLTVTLVGCDTTVYRLVGDDTPLYSDPSSTAVLATVPKGAKVKLISDLPEWNRAKIEYQSTTGWIDKRCGLVRTEQELKALEEERRIAQEQKEREERERQNREARTNKLIAEGKALIAQKKWKEAENKLSEALKLNPNAQEAKVLLDKARAMLAYEEGMSLLTRGSYAKATEKLTEAVVRLPAADPDSKRVKEALAKAQQKTWGAPGYQGFVSNDIEIVSWRCYKDPTFGGDGAIVIVGELRNNTDRYIELVRVEVTLYDKAGVVTDSDYTYVRGLAPGAKKSFKFYATYYGTEERASLQVHEGY